MIFTRIQHVFVMPKHHRANIASISRVMQYLFIKRYKIVRDSRNRL